MLIDDRLTIIYAFKEGEVELLENLNKDFENLQLKYAGQFNDDLVDHPSMEDDFSALREQYELLMISINGSNTALAEIRKRLRVEKLKQPYSESRIRERWTKTDRENLRQIKQMLAFIDTVVKICRSSGI
jgi:biopolymer transport protein ExbB/TolQ